MRKPLIAAASLLLVATPFALAQDRTEAKTDAKTETKAYEIGAKIDPDLSLPDIAGKTHRLGDYKDKVVVIDFWSIQCPWSIKYEKALLDLHAQYKDKDVVFLAINSNNREVDWDAEKPYARIQEYVDEAKVTYPILIDEGNLVADLFAAKTTPHVYVIDGKGVLAYAGGVDDNPKGDPDKETTHYVADAVDAILAGKPVATPTTKSFGCSIKRVKQRGMQ